VARPCNCDRRQEAQDAGGDFMRGAADGLNIVVPFGVTRYRELRPNLGLQAPRPGDDNDGNGPFGSVIDLDGKFGLNAGLRPLKALWDKKQLAIVEATGSPDPSRSHFDAQDYMESGTPGKTGNGWLNRAVGDAAPDSSPLRAVALSNRVPRTLRREHEAIALGNLRDFNISDQDRLAILKNMFSLTPDAQLRQGAADKSGRTFGLCVQGWWSGAEQSACLLRGLRLRQESAAIGAADQVRCGRGGGVRGSRRLGSSSERKWAAFESFESVLQCDRRILRGSGGSDGGCRYRDDV
jgi:hypothetical protein